jgi:hypothetical protein
MPARSSARRQFFLVHELGDVAREVGAIGERELRLPAAQHADATDDVAGREEPVVAAPSAYALRPREIPVPASAWSMRRAGRA